MPKSPEKLGEIIQSRLFQMRKRSDRFFKGLETDLKRLNKMTTRVTNKLYDQVLSSLETIPGTSMPINTVGNLSQVSTLMQGLDAIQNDYRQAYGQLIRNARLDMLEIVITREAALEKVLKDEEGIIEDRTLVSDQSFEMMDAGYQKTLQRMNVTLDKWKSFAYDTFYSGLIKGVPISLFKSWFFNEDGTLKIGSSLDEESTYTAVQSIVEQRTAYLRGKALENGWKYCWNSNPMDPLTKSECIDATIAGVISEAEMGSGYGFPPRYICRCEIVYTRPEWVRVNQGVNTSIEKSRQSLVQQLINAPRQKGKWTRNGKVVKAKDITRAKGNLMYKDVEDKLGLLADRGSVPDFDFDDFGGVVPGGGIGGVARPEWSPTMTSKQASEWAKDSVDKRSFYHSTRTKQAQGIEKEGFARSQIGSTTGNKGMFGEGFYLSKDMQYTKTYGDATLKMKINVKNPRHFKDADEFTEFLKKHKIREDLWDPVWLQGGKETGAGKITDILKKEGYDAVMFRGGVETVIFDPRQIVVIK